ncbi:class I SAM-dependent methyltransferase [Trichormus sp. NMC-1]|uniref:class I SAM-dependent methyltransferase n=1 Tax=Trichormus sp. NMC-1 TaxID=1853259 RepID=UPI0008DBF88C|nr:class I SAM-dependent methyltransferase [Trichormus sp. NMC-1]
MSEQTNRLRYFNIVLDSIEKQNQEVIEAFGHHVHWGYWDSNSLPDGSVEDFRRATEKLSVKMCEAGRITDNQRVLDVGCGFGGTIATINNRYKNMDLVGVNIDERQLARARELVLPAATNKVEFVEADACKLPFENNSFDVVLAVECVFHFPSRELFFQEAKRVLKPGGYLAICDFTPADIVMPWIGMLDFVFNGLFPSTYGQNNLNLSNNITLHEYEKLAEKRGFRVVYEHDITVNTLPTYPISCQVMRKASPPGWDTEVDMFLTQTMEWFSRQGLYRYIIFSFEALS